VSRTAQPRSLKEHLRAADSGDRRRVCELPHGAAPHAHRCRGRARRRRAGRRVHDARGSRRRRPAGDGDLGCCRRARRAPARDRQVRERDRGRRDAHGRGHREGDRLRRGRGHDRLAACACAGGAGPRLPLGDGDVPPDAAPRRPRRGEAGGDARGDRGGPARRTTGR
jgi:hypothetical protein